VTDHSTVLLVEGIKKADYAADATGYVAISIPGVACTASAQSALEALAGDVAIVALDRDDPAKDRTLADVARAREALARLAISLGYGVRIAHWDNADGKGLDDLLIGGKTYMLARYGGTTVNGNGSRIGNQTELLGHLVEIVHIHSVNHKHKLGLIASLIALYEAEHDPRQQPDELGCYRILTCHLADEMGVSANTASTTLRELAGPDYGYLRHCHTKDPKDGKTITYLGLGPKRLGAKDKVPEPPHLAKERERKRRCPRCRSGALEPASFVCTDCGHVCTVQEAEAAAQATVLTADGRLADKHTGEVFTTPQGPPTESVGGEPTTATTTTCSPDIGPPDFVGGPPTTVLGASRHTVTVHESVAGPDGGPFPVIYADPPWRYVEGTTSPNRIVENHYATMALEDICALPLPQWAAPNAVLFLWSPAPKLEEAFQVMKAWGFGYKTSMAWVKDRIGMGHWVRQQHELLLIGRRGAMPAPPPSVRVPSVVYAPRREHSRKPDEMYSIIEHMYPDVPKLELFARTRRPGWTAHGNEVDRFAADRGDEGVRGPHRERASASRRPLRSR
jgi:N6-adenosine-specific RNA methylase IME4